MVDININERAQKILSLAVTREQGASVLATPELSLCGCSPSNAMLQSSFLLVCKRRGVLILGTTS
ncbi:hypothetical protein [Candidatus Ichthyocystis sparus]|uniref:hypothetical protein n=1 Tax=Candidatus Ichthyocystis sparus TaxID=1561004 RepID=UPI000B8A218F|nr:hypothetical protein [Candidatus Ichthyocystis sparus]